MSLDKKNRTKHFKIFGVPFDGTVSYRPGARFGPAAVRENFYGIEDYSPVLDSAMGADLYELCQSFPILDIPIGNTEKVIDMIEEYVDNITSVPVESTASPMGFGGKVGDEQSDNISIFGNSPTNFGAINGDGQAENGDNIPNFGNYSTDFPMANGDGQVENAKNIPSFGNSPTDFGAIIGEEQVENANNIPSFDNSPTNFGAINGEEQAENGEKIPSFDNSSTDFGAINGEKQAENANPIPIIIGGEHLVTLGAVRSLVKKFPNLHIIHFDAHADLREDYLGVKLSHACVMRRCIELGCGLTQFGIRSGTQEEFEFKRKILGEFVPKYVPRIDGNSEFPSENQPGQTVHENQFTSKNQSENGFSGKNQIVQTVHENQFTDEIQSVNQLSANKIPKNAPCYLSIDLDVLDPSIFCGTGTPEPGGWLWNEFIAHVYDVLSNYNIVGADIVELAPNYDPSGVSTVVACKVLREILLALSQN